MNKDPQLSLIEVDRASQSEVAGSKKTGLLFYASGDLTHCSTITLSKEGITICYSNGNVEKCNEYMEVDDLLLDRLAKQANPLLDEHHHTLQATHMSDFTINYGIKSTAFKNVVTGNSITLQGSVDGTKKPIEKVDFLLAEGTTDLVDLVRHILTNQNRDEVVQIKDNETSKNYNSVYHYIKIGNCYHLRLFNNIGPAVKGSQRYGSMNRETIGQIVNSSAKKIPQEGVSVDPSKERTTTSDIVVQTEFSLSEANHTSTQQDTSNESDLEWDYSDLSPYPDEDLEDLLEPKDLYSSSNEEEDGGVSFL